MKPALAPLPTRRRPLTLAGRLALGLPLTLAFMALACLNPPGAAALTFPGKAPCNKTLQRCIKKAPRGAVIRIARNRPVRETIVIKRSVTLVAAKGFEPVLGSPGVTRRIEVENPGAKRVEVAIRQLKLRNVEVEASFNDAGSGHSFVFEDSSIMSPFGDTNGTTGVSVYSTRPARIAIRRNEIATKGDPVELGLMSETGLTEASVIHNTITTSDNPAGVDPNLSAGGIEVNAQGAGEVRANVYGNLIYGVAGCHCGGADAVDIEAEAAAGSINFVGNTVDDAQYSASALEVNGGAPGADMTVNVFDNLFTNAADAVVDFPTSPPPGLTIVHDYNDVYDPGDPPHYGGYPAGPHSDMQDPLYVDAAGHDYRLQAGSPQRAQGLVCTPGGQTLSDLAGRARVELVDGQGAFLTPGVFGFSSAASNGRLVLGDDDPSDPDDVSGSAGDDVICGYAGDDELSGGRGSDAIFGGDGDDTIRGDRGKDFLYGENGLDVITGGIGPDYMSGGEDSDELNAADGVGGNDILDGGGDIDACHLDPGDTFMGC